MVHTRAGGLPWSTKEMDVFMVHKRHGSLLWSIEQQESFYGPWKS